MASIRHEILVDATPEHVWAALRDVGDVHRRLVPDYCAATQIDGDIRILTFTSGAKVRERIVDIDDAARRLAYAVIEGRMPLEHHHASFQVFAAGSARCLLVWITDFLPSALAPLVREHIERGAVVMKRTLEAAARA